MVIGYDFLDIKYKNTVVMLLEGFQDWMIPLVFEKVCIMKSPYFR